MFARWQRVKVETAAQSSRHSGPKEQYNYFVNAAVGNNIDKEAESTSVYEANPAYVSFIKGTLPKHWRLPASPTLTL